MLACALFEGTASVLWAWNPFPLYERLSSSCFSARLSVAKHALYVQVTALYTLFRFSAIRLCRPIE